MVTSAAAGEYVPVAAARIVDSQSGSGPVTSPLGAGQTVSFPVLGVGGVPASGVSAVALDVTAMNASLVSFLTVFPAGTARPSTSAIDVQASGTMDNMTIVEVGSNGMVSVYNNAGSVGLTVDVEGYVTDSTDTTAQSTFTALRTPLLFDTRNGTNTPQSPLGAGATLPVSAGGQAGIPTSGVTAIALQLTAISATATTSLKVWKASGTMPADPALDAPQGQNIAKTVIVPVDPGSSAQIDIYNAAGSLNLQGAVEGYFLAPTGTAEGETFIPSVQTRVLDTRNGTGGKSGPVGNNADFAVTVTGPSATPPAGVSAVMMDVIAPNTTQGGTVMSYTTGTNKSGPTLNLTPNQVDSNVVIVKTSTAGQVSFFVSMLASGTTDVVADVYGYFVFTELSSPTDQARVATTATLSSVADSSDGYVDYLSRTGPTGTWALIPPALVTQAGVPLTGWPLAAGSSGFPSLVWQAADTLGSASGSLQVEDCVSPTSTDPDTVCSAPATVQITPHAFDGSWATDSVGPGTVSLVTGDYQVSGSDAAVSSYTGSLSVGREFDSILDDHLSVGQKDVEGSTGTNLFGPHQATVTASTAHAYTGSQSLQITPAATGTSNDTWTDFNDAPVGLSETMLPGHTYRFTTHVYVPSSTGLPTGSDSSNAERAVAWTYVSGWTSVAAPAPTVTDSWQTETVTFTVPMAAVLGLIRLYNGKVEGSGLPVYYDGSSLIDDGILGPGWRPDLPGPDAGAGEETVIDQTANAGYVLLADSDGDQDVYLANGSTASYPISYTGQGDANDGSTLTKVNSTTMTLSDPDGTLTTWTMPAGSTTWQTTSVAETGTAGQNTTKYLYDSADRATQIVGPAPNGVTCTPGTGAGNATLTPGCRTLTLTYATTTTATGTTSGTWGSYTGQLASVAYVAADPANPTTMSATTVVTYAYDVNGYLRQVTDPRPDGGPLSTTYGYDSTGRISIVTPPGLNGWTLNYDSSNRLANVQRTDPANGTATTTMAYGVPLTGSGLPDLNSTPTDNPIASWGQVDDVPVTATAVFQANHVPAATPTSSDWPYADVHYLDVNGRETNTASYGAGSWQYGATDYDQYGNTLWSLTAENRAEALAPIISGSSCNSSNPLGTTDYAACAAPTSQAAAALLETSNTYTQDGVELLDTLGPVHPATLSDGTHVDAREHTHTVYSDQDGSEPAHTGPAYRLPTTITTSAQTTDGTDHDTRTTLDGYPPIDGSSATGPTSGWTLHQPTTVTTVIPGGTNIVTATLYDASGRALQTRQPTDQASASPGTTAGTTVNSYYTTGSGTGCANTVFAGMLCTSGPAAAPSGGTNTLPTTTTTYDYYGEPVTTSEASGASTRTTSIVYDQAERTHSVTVTGSQGTSVPAVTTGYDGASGLPTTVTTGSSTLTTSYDALGRATGYTDAAGTASTTGYDIDSRPTAIYDGKGTATDVYDGTDAAGLTEHRGLITKIHDPVVGNFTANYNADGNILSQVYPSGLIETWTYDNAGQPTSLKYALGGSTWMTYTAGYSAHGQIVDATGPLDAKHYTYDADSRLTQAQDTYGGTCTNRDYTYDADTNRTGLVTHPASSGTTCSDSTTPTSSVTHSYNTGDQLTDTGYSYDAFGRTLTAPAADLTGTGPMTLSYYVNDMVASETQGTATDSFTLDPLQNRVYTETTSAGTLTNHYNDSSDSPSWTKNADGSWTRDITGIDGSLAATQDSSGTITLQLSDMHDNIGATATNSPTATGPTTTLAYTEFGNPETGSTPPTPYGAFGAKQRSDQDLGGLTLMGQRLYNATSGRFLQTDPVPGGSANNYDYCDQDPVNCSDLDGTHKRHRRHHRHQHDGGASSSSIFSWVGLAAVQFIPGIEEFVDSDLFESLLGLANDGSGNFDMGWATEEQSDQLGEAFVGPDARDTAVGRQSADRQRSYRRPTNKSYGGRAANFERRTGTRGRYPHNGHLKIW